MKDVSFLANSPAARQWEKIEIKPHHGIAVPLFSIHSANSYGIGEYTDLPLLIDWCASIGFDVIQLLPLNDCGLGISPYSAHSAFALNPLFLGIASLPHVYEYPELKMHLKLLPDFPIGPRVDYPHVRKFKEMFLEDYYKLIGPQLLKTEAYHLFVEKAPWLKGYAAFKILKARFHGTLWKTWPDKERAPTSEIIDSIIFHERDQFIRYCFFQFLCDLQLKSVKKYASHRKISLMGDIPILIDRDSADVWQHQELFDLKFSAGAPPDFFSENGQNWGFPIYNWKAMEDQGYQWWIDRLTYASRYYQIYRLDHIVGFFRIWAIPLEKAGKQGRFIPQDESTWIDHGKRILLMMLNACDMLPIGEDLGVVPQEVRSCLSALGICGTRVMRWERKWKEKEEFIYPQDYSIDSMTTVSTHDSETLQHWWEKNQDEAKLFAKFKGWHYDPHLSFEHHREILWDSHHSTSLFHINLLQEYLPLVPGLCGPNPEDERINIPGLISDHNWSYRFRLKLEELANQSTLKHLIQEIIR